MLNHSRALHNVAEQRDVKTYKGINKTQKIRQIAKKRF